MGVEVTGGHVLSILLPPRRSNQALTYTWDRVGLINYFPGAWKLQNSCWRATLLWPSRLSNNHANLVW